MNTTSSLLVPALASWAFLPALAALLAYASVSLTTIGIAAAVITGLSLMFETSRDWLLDLLV